jgi:hypothetical protein
MTTLKKFRDLEGRENLRKFLIKVDYKNENKRNLL